jgi:hypothetical protein
MAAESILPTKVREQPKCAREGAPIFRGGRIRDGLPPRLCNRFVAYEANNKVLVTES